MELCHELLGSILRGEKAELVLSLSVDCEQFLEKECYKALRAIREILRDNTLDDETCFEKIEEIVCLFESMNVDCGSRHDFG